MYNKIIVAGNLTRDIEMKYIQGGTAIANTAIASTRKFKGQDGAQKEEVLFVDIALFGRTAEIANQYLRKGSKVLVDGRLKLDQWTQDDGTKRSKHSITVENLTMLGSKDYDQQNGGQQGEHNQNGGQQGGHNQNGGQPNGGYQQNGGQQGGYQQNGGQQVNAGNASGY